MSDRAKKFLILASIPLLLLGVTTVPSGGWRMMNNARQVVIEFFDTGDATFDGDVTATSFIGDGSALTGISGSGDVTGPGSSTDNALTRFDSTTGKIIQNSTATLDDSGNLTATSFIGDGSALTGIAGSGDVDGPASATDNAIARFDSTTGKLIQNSAVTIADTSGNMAGVGTINTHTIPGGTGTLALTSQITGTNSGTNTGDVTLSGTPDYITISGQVITRGAVDLAADVTGTLPVANGGTGATTLGDAGVLIGNGTGAVAVTGAGTSGQVLTSNGAGVDPTFQTISGTGDIVGPGSSTDNAVTRFDSTTGKLVQNSAVTIDDSGNIVTAGTVDGVDVSGIVSNATHTGDVTGATSLTIDKTAITGKTDVTMVGADSVLFSDASDTGNLKEGLLSDLSAIVTGLADSQISNTLTSSIFVGSGSTTNAVDLATAEVSGELADANVSNTLQSSLFVGSGSTTSAIDLATAEVAGDLAYANIAQQAEGTILGRAVGAGTGDATALTFAQQRDIVEEETELASSTNATAWTGGTIYFHDTLTENTTVSAMTGTPRNRQKACFSFKAATGSDYTLAWNSSFAAGSGSPFAGTIPAVTTTDGRKSVYLFEYSTTDSKWWLMAHREDN